MSRGLCRASMGARVYVVAASPHGGSAPRTGVPRESHPRWRPLRRARTGDGAPGRGCPARRRRTASWSTATPARTRSARVRGRGRGSRSSGSVTATALPRLGSARGLGSAGPAARHRLWLGARPRSATARRGLGWLDRLPAAEQRPHPSEEADREARRRSGAMARRPAAGSGSAAADRLGLRLRLGGCQPARGSGSGFFGASPAPACWHRLRLGRLPRAARRAGPSGRAVRITFVPHPEGSSRTVPLASSPSQATAVSGSSLVIRISPKEPFRWRASASALLHSAHSSGGDLTRVRLASCSVMPRGFVRPGGTPSGLRRPAEGLQA